MAPGSAGRGSGLLTTGQLPASAIAAAQGKGRAIPLRTTTGMECTGTIRHIGAVAFSGETMRRLIDKSGLRLIRPFLKGS